MIGVRVQPAEEGSARELFELCKTPWELYRDNVRYEVVICTSEPPPRESCQLILFYGTSRTGFDVQNEIPTNSQPHGVTIIHQETELPIYGAATTFPAASANLACDKETKEAMLFACRLNEQTVVRIGYDLFTEIHFLLAEGQPVKNADKPTLDLHLALLRDLITRAGLPFVEIPAVPDGYEFIACLTHDVDHPMLRNHFFDHTMLGFFCRASIGSTINALRGKLALGRMWKNWIAAARLPFIYLGLSKDIWLQFGRYLEIEAGLGSTYFVIPKRDYPGRKKDGTFAAKRACHYGLAELVPELKKVRAAGNEVGLHGLDAWRDAAIGREERSLISQALGISEIGVRMHWLYFDRDSPSLLDQAAFTYDSTVGYNETVGYRAGTAQVYRPPGTVNLLELPLLVMDTALFYPSYLHLPEDEAYLRILSLLDKVVKLGGALTINWHDRSLAPERSWGTFYIRIIEELKRRGAWFPTAARAVAWFRKRRQATIESEQSKDGLLTIRSSLEKPDALPGLRVRIHRPCLRNPTECLATGTSASFLDVKLDKLAEFTIRI